MSERPFPRPDASVLDRPLEATGETLNWGVVSTGNIAHSVSRDLQRLPDARILAVTSRTEGKAKEFAREFDVPRTYWDQESTTAIAQLAADADIDVAYVATPHAQHFEIVRELLEAGKHVLVEKAITLNARQAEELVNLAREKNLFLMEGLWARFTPGITRAFDLIADGAIGEPRWVQANLGFASEFDTSHRLWGTEAGGGALLDITIYPLNWAIGTLGFPSTLNATADKAPNGVDAQNTLTLSYENGATAQLLSTLQAHTPAQATVGGTSGWLRTTEGPLHNPTAITYQSGNADPVTERFEVTGRGYTYELREVTRRVQAGDTSSDVMDWQASIGIMRLFDEARAQLGISYPGE